MKLNKAEIFLREIGHLFLTHFFDFELYEPEPLYANFVYYHNFRANMLSIVVILPLVRNKDGQLEMTGRKIKISLKKTGDATKPHLIELTDTLIIRKWEERIRERVGILKELVAEIHKCETCDIFKMPRISKTNDLKRTTFVSLKCPTCHKYTSTSYGRGLKTRLHRNLKRKRSG